MTDAKREHNPALDTLRSIAIALVVVGHLVVPLSGEGHVIVRAINVLTQRGVDLFFVLSGYLIGGIAIAEAARTGTLRIGRFWQRRWMRTLPAYYVTLAIYALKELVPHKSAGLIHPTAYVFFLQTYVIGRLADFAHSWSLCVEEHFYLVLPLLVLLLCRIGKGSARAIGVVVALVAVGLAVHRLSISDGLNERLSHLRADGLSVGVCVAALHHGRPDLMAAVRDRHRLFAVVGIVLTVAASALDLSSSLWGQSAFAVACGLWVILAAARMPALDWVGSKRAVKRVAQISYSLYLFHPLVIGTLDQFYFGRHPMTAGLYLVYVVLSVVGSVVVSAMSYQFVERTVLALRDRMTGTTIAQGDGAAGAP